ncbi:MAG: RluA family pseudouridine synthase [Eubacteriales bacterium]
MEKRSFEIIISDLDAGKRLDVVIPGHINDISRNYIQKLIEEGNIQVNNKVVKIKKHQVAEGDIIIISIPESKPLEVTGSDIPINIVYEDEDIIIVDKPKGMVVHPSTGNYTGTLVNAILFHCNDLSGINGVERPGIVHRIDKDTSGLLMVAKNDNAHRSLARQLKEHTINREYRAIVYGNIKEDRGTLSYPIGRDPNNRLKMKVIKENSKDATTHYEVIERFGNYTYLKFKLETGRTHQIRVHMSHINHAIIGDKVYGPEKNIFGLKSQLLHAKKLGFIHPTKNEYVEFESELPNEFQEILNSLMKKRGV